MSLSNGLDGECFLTGASRNAYGTFRIDKVTPESDVGVRFTHSEKPSRMDKTSYS